MQDTCKYMQNYAVENMHKYEICKIYANICKTMQLKICTNIPKYASNMQLYAVICSTIYAVICSNMHIC